MKCNRKRRVKLASFSILVYLHSSCTWRRIMNSVRETVRALGRVLIHVNEQMPICALEGLSFEREEHPENRAKLSVADIPSEFWGEAFRKEGFPQSITVEALRFASGDHIDLHRHNGASSSILVPGKDVSACPLLGIEMFRDRRSSLGPRSLKRSIPCGIRPKVWHSITRFGEGNYAYLFSASAPIIGNDIEWYAEA